jgi:hypothetical protein
MCTTCFRTSRRNGLRMAEVLRVALRWRGRRRPAGAPGVAVSASLRLRCGARSRAVRQNSLRAPKGAPLRQAAGDQITKRALARTAPALCSSPPHKSPPPGTACRAEAWSARGRWEANNISAKARVGCPVQCACEAPRSAGWAACARSAHRPHFSGICLSAAPFGARSELCRTADRPSTAGQGRACPSPVSPKRCAGQTARAFAARSPNVGPQGSRVNDEGRHP